MRATRPTAPEPPDRTRAGSGPGRGGLLRAHPVASAVVAAAAVTAAIVVLTVFQPQRLLLNERVDDASPLANAPTTTAPTEPARTTPTGGDGDPATTPTDPPGPKVLGQGAFRGLAHRGSGKALLVERADGRRVLRFEDLDVENGPDLFVYLSTAAADSAEDTFDDDFVSLGRLKGNQGNQNYELPAGLAPSGYNSVVIWCRRFSVGFAVAPIT